MIGDLNSHIVRAMVGLTLLAFAVVYFGLLAYFFFLYDWLYPDAADVEVWQLGDAVMLGLLLGTGILTASGIGWRLARRIADPLKSVAEAARRVAQGDFSARANLSGRGFGEARELVADFNHMAERLQRAEGELAYSNSAIAHELRTPLTILRGRLQGLSDGVFAPSPELYGRLIAHVDDLSAIVEELRTLALGNAGKLDLHRGPLDLGAETAAALATMADDLTAAGLGIDTQFSPAPVLADRARLRQMVVAVLDNCRRYAPGSRVRLETGVEGTADGCFSVIRCADSGPGLSAENRARAFERFWRAEESRGRRLGGSGLGLSIVRAIARAHGGDATLADSGPPGLTVEIRLPCPPPEES
ncbi:sensor histidine kinase [Novispirillum itersonii]|uniref:histidine kinase n=1 Tax=Novispirillum itersonii TaxID=189 RepID=A0A7X0DNK3_NOVIT|nr:HAMP domain-containing sensor histidine kinase [Novispirillum itersonii]MBB6210332.1 two-component system sensor histidine kinase AdeS [Novispirillum itersonii]